MNRSAAAYYGSSEPPLVEASERSLEQHDLITFLAVCQSFRADFLPITWQPKLGVLGEGRTAGVSQSEVDGRTRLAYKRLRDEKDRSKSYEKLETEVRALKSSTITQHPNIIRVEGVCWETTGHVLPVLVFAKAELGDLAHYMDTQDGKSTDMDTRIRWCQEITSATLALHNCGIIHGDIKPRNILVFLNDNGNPIVKLADFGFSTTSEREVKLPHSWPWVAPEWHPLSFGFEKAKLAEVYSIGLVSIWILLVRTSEMLNQTAYPDLKDAPDESSPRQVVEELRRFDKLPEFTALLLKETSLSEPTIASVSQFVARTARFNPSQRETSLEKLTGYLSKASISSSSSEAQMQPSDSVISVQEKFRIHRHLHHLVMAVPEVRNAITKAFEQKATSCSCHTLGEKCSEKEYAAFEVAVCYELGFGVHRDPNISAAWLERSGKHPKVLSETLETLRKEVLVPEFQDGLWKSLYDSGHITMFDYAAYHRERQTLEETESQYRREISDLETVLGKDHGAVCTIKSTLVDILKDEGRLPQAADLAQQVWDSRVRLLGPENHFTLMAMGNLAVIVSHMGNWNFSEELHRLLFKRCEKALGPDHPSTIGAMANFGSVLRLRGKQKEARDLDENMVKRQMRIFGREHLETIAAVLNLAATYRACNELERAASIEEEYIEIARRILPDGHPVHIRAESNLAMTYARCGRLQEAEKLRTDLLDLCEKTLGRSHPATMINKYNLASINLDLGRPKQAEDLLVEVIGDQTDRLGAEHGDTLASRIELGRALYIQGHLPAAEEILSLAVPKLEIKLGSESPKTLAARALLAKVLADRLTTEE